MDSLIGIKTSKWWQLLQENKFRVDSPFWFKALGITLLSLKNSVQAKREEKEFADSIEKIQIKDEPLFLLGHWRSGTTHLHNILINDEQFAFPNIFEVKNPSTFLTREARILDSLKRVGAHSRPMDNVQVTISSPGEDEFALGALSLRTPYLAWPFPRNEAYYNRYLTFQQVSQSEIDAWKQAFLLFMKKLTLKHQRRLILKSPTHTARIKLLLELFPRAQFVHIHRNPYVVYQSTTRLYSKALTTSYLQRPDQDTLAQGILARYQSMYDAFFAQKQLIPAGQFFEISYEDLEAKPAEQIENIYQALNIPGFLDFKPELRKYLDSIADYRKNVHETLSNEIKSKIATLWHRSFSEWGYKI